MPTPATYWGQTHVRLFFRDEASAIAFKLRWL